VLVLRSVEGQRVVEGCTQITAPTQETVDGCGN
jgi:hypothetical protein